MAIWPPLAGVVTSVAVTVYPVMVRPPSVAVVVSPVKATDTWLGLTGAHHRGRGGRE